MKFACVCVEELSFARTRYLLATTFDVPHAGLSARHSVQQPAAAASAPATEPAAPTRPARHNTSPATSEWPGFYPFQRSSLFTD